MGTEAARLEAVPTSSFKAVSVSLGHRAAPYIYTGGMYYQLILETWTSSPLAAGKMQTYEADLRSARTCIAAEVLPLGPCARREEAQRRPAGGAATAYGTRGRGTAAWMRGRVRQARPAEDGGIVARPASGHATMQVWRT